MRLVSYTIILYMYSKFSGEAVWSLNWVAQKGYLDYSLKYYLKL